jgi:hypothetical protein
MPSDQPPPNAPPASVWTTPPVAPPAASIPHSYPLAVRDHGLGTAFGLLMQSLPYALARCGILLAYSLGGIIWLVITFGGAAWLGTHIAGAVGVVWFVLCIVGVGWFWGAVLRYLLHLLACGHVAVLTDLITRGQVGNGNESQLAYGKRVVTERFGQVNALFGLNMVVRGILAAFHQTLDWVADTLPIPGLESLSHVVNIVLRAATRYLDKVILSYNLARNDQDPWRGAREGIVYYCQNAKPILKTSVWIVILERLLSFVVWLALLTPAAAITVMLPASVRESGGIVTVVIAVLLAATVRAAFIKPLFLIMMMVRFHALIENQPINQEWDTRLSGISDKFRTLGEQGAPAFR